MNRLPSLLRRRAAEDARVAAFLAAIRMTADCCDACGGPAPAPTVIPEPRVELVDGRWQLDTPSRARLADDDTRWMPAIILTASAPLR